MESWDSGNAFGPKPLRVPFRCLVVPDHVQRVDLVGPDTHSPRREVIEVDLDAHRRRGEGPGVRDELPHRDLLADLLKLATGRVGDKDIGRLPVAVGVGVEGGLDHLLVRGEGEVDVGQGVSPSYS